MAGGAAGLGPGGGAADEWRRQKAIYSEPNSVDRLDLGFSMFYLSRCNRSGIPTAGVIGGLDQTGPWKIDARFERNELIRRIEVIAAQKKRINVKNMDAEKFIDSHVTKLPTRTLVYLDPPYFHKADRLYRNHYEPADHARIARVIQADIRQNWVVSYDSAPQIIRHYKERRSFKYALQYNAARAYKGTEVFVFSDDLKLPLRSEVATISKALQRLARAG